MSELPAMLAGLGILGLLGVLALASLFCLVQPVWALVDCVDSDRDGETKVLLSIAIFFTWGLGSLVYGLFFARSANLRRFTIVASLVLAAITVASFGSCVSGMATHARRVATRAEERRAEMERRAASFRPAAVDANAVAPFHAILFARTGPHSATTALAEFTLAGPVPSSARDVRGGVRHVSHDAERGRTFALTQHAFGALSPRTGEFIEIAVDPGFDFSWPRGLAWDPVSQQAVVVTSHVYTRFFRYDPQTSAWEELPVKLRDLPVAGLAYVPEAELFYALSVQPNARELTHLQRFNRSGSSLGPLALTPAIPLADGRDAERAQIQHSSGELVVMLPPFAADGFGEPDRIFLIDPRTGSVAAHAPASTL
jgi:hypothetical protein